MKRISSIFGIIFVTAMCFGVAAHSQKPVNQTKAPAVSDSLKAKFFKAQSQLLQAQNELQSVQKQVQERTDAFQKTVNELLQACGPSSTASLDKDGDLVCVAKPEAPKAEVKPAFPKK